ncbi:MAG: HK97 gp10 family phage protein [Pirellulales bacterium]
MQVTMVTTGDAEVNRQLSVLTGPEQKKAVRKASRVSLKPMAVQMRQAAPRRTGRLSRAVKVRAMARSRVRIGSKVSLTGKASAFSGKAFYGGFLEWGWRAGRRVRNSDLGLKRGAKRSPMMAAIARNRNNARKQIPGKHWMMAVVKQTKDECLTIYKSELVQFIRSVAKGKS